MTDTKLKPASLLGCELRPLTKDESLLMLRISIAKLEGDPDQVFADELGFQGKVLFARLNAHGLKVDKQLILMLTVLAETPGDLVMWAWTLFNMQKNGERLTLKDWADAFALGVPTKEAYHKVWDGQKDKDGRNLLDLPSTWVL